MTTNVKSLSTREAAERAWRIRHLLAERALDRTAAQFSLSLLYQQTESQAVRRLCVHIAEMAPAPEPVVETFAR